MVIITSGTRAGPVRAIHSSRRPVSMLPLNGCSADGRPASGKGRSAATAPLCSMLARVVSKCVLPGTSIPGLHICANRICSAARPWWVGITCVKPKISRTAAAKRSKLRLPA